MVKKKYTVENCIISWYGAYFRLRVGYKLAAATTLKKGLINILKTFIEKKIVKGEDFY